MTSYQEMQDAALKSQQKFDGMRNRANASLAKIVTGFVEHCQVPFEQITILKWNEIEGDVRGYEPAENGKRYNIPAACLFDESDKFWHVGIRLNLSQGQFAQFVLCTSESDEDFSVRLGRTGAFRKLNINSADEVNAFCDSVCSRVVELYSEPKASASRSIGFN
jgi:hypothetical protein